MLTPLCDSCRFSKEEIQEIIKPDYAFSTVHFHKAKHLTIWCNYSFTVKAKIIKKCDNYKPKAGKIGKRLYQKQIGEN
jgi:hypothetical protein